MAHGDYSRGLKSFERKQQSRMQKILIIAGLLVVGSCGVALIVYARYPELFIR
jgi:hypothetical protein